MLCPCCFAISRIWSDGQTRYLLARAEAGEVISEGPYTEGLIVPLYCANFLTVGLAKRERIWAIAISFNLFSRSDWGIACLINTELMLSKFDYTTSCSKEASSRILPSDLGFSSLHCFAVLLNNAIFSMSASVA